MNKQDGFEKSCPSCGHNAMRVFYRLEGLPVHSVLLLETRQKALDYPRGDLALGFCEHCGFVSNLAFDPEVHEYSEKYEATQGYSSTFNAFHRRLATSLVERYDLRHKRILEIGCGQGEFLTLLCELGDNEGIGFDPAYAPDRLNQPPSQKLTFIQDFYSEKYSDMRGDFLCCKMTLEHIHPTGDFVHTVRQSIGERYDTVVFFQVPNARYVFGELAFWDIYYEHCSYFSLGSIGRLFRRSGFEVLDLWTDYDDQYLMIEASPSHPFSGDQTLPLIQENDLENLTREITEFSIQVPDKIAAWKTAFEQMGSEGKKIVLWGGGSKAVAFLTTLGVGINQVEYVVDINPHKAGTFLAGTGQEVVAPEFLKEYRPEVVIVMNPVYCAEIGEHLKSMNLAPELLSVKTV